MTATIRIKRGFLTQVTLEEDAPAEEAQAEDDCKTQG